jgi:hypothetical protein
MPMCYNMIKIIQIDSYPFYSECIVISLGTGYNTYQIPVVHMFILSLMHSISFIMSASVETYLIIPSITIDS